jgi:glycine/D-amino acid oxidase-like deaminating enzyme
MFWLEAGAQYSQTPCFFFERPYGIFYGFPGTETGLKLAEHSGGIEIPTPEPHPAVLDSEISPVRRFIEECIPDLGPIKKSAGCYYTMTPDQHFVIDVHPRHANVSYAAGFSGHGFKFSSVVGEVLADLAAVGETKQAIEFLRAKRLI